MKKLLTFFAALWLTSLVQAQTSCGLSHHAEALIRQQSKALLDKHDGATISESTRYIPIRFHLVGNSQGQKRLTYARAFQFLCQLNTDFKASPTNIQFYLLAENGTLMNETIDSDLLFEFDAASSDALVAYKSTQALNVFFVDEIKSNGILIINGLYQPQSQVIVIAKKQSASYPKSLQTLSHEAGHALGLLHPFAGYDMSWFTPGIVQVPNLPIFELMDGSNCTTTADLLCDTKPDYGDLWAAENCQYTGQLLDPTGVPITPNVDNIMSGYPSCQQYYFTSEQCALMNLTLSDPANAAWQSNFTPAGPSLQTYTTHPGLSPSNGSINQNPAEVVLDWIDAVGASHYLVEVDLVPTFVSPVFMQYLVLESEITLTNLEHGKKYYWRITPVNAAESCAPVGSLIPQTFVTKQLSDIDALSVASSISLQPNFLRLGSAQTIRVTGITDGSMSRLRIFDALGRELRNWAISADGQIELEPISIGVYWVEVKTQRQRALLKFVVAN